MRAQLNNETDTDAEEPEKVLVAVDHHMPAPAAGTLPKAAPGVAGPARA